MAKNQSDNSTHEIQQIEAVVGVFDDASAARLAADQLRGAAVKLIRVSQNDPTAENHLPQVVFDDVDSIQDDDVMHGVVKGGAIGAGSGLLFIGFPGLNVAAPIVGALAGAWIGGIAAIDETRRRIDLPDAVDYRQLLSEGKSFVVISGDEPTRIEFAAGLEKAGAIEVHQHPPVREASFHKPDH